MQLRSRIKSVLSNVNLAAILMAGITTVFTLLGAPAVLAQSGAVYHCVPFVVNTTAPMPSPVHGMNPLLGGTYAELIAPLAALNASAVPKHITGLPLTGTHGAGEACHADAVALFNGLANTAHYGSNGVTAHSGNLEWSDSAKLCARTEFQDGKRHTIGVYEIITEVGGAVTGHTGGYNLVAGYSVTCKASIPTNVVNLTVPVVVQTLP